MNYNLHRIVTLCSLLLASGCSSPTDSGSLPVDLSLSSGSVYLQPAFSASVIAGVVHVHGQFGTDPCHIQPRVHATLNSGTLTFTLTRGSGSSTCSEVLVSKVYDAGIRGVPPGNYHLVVEHRGTDDVYIDASHEWVELGDGTRLEEDIVVP